MRFKKCLSSIRDAKHLVNQDFCLRNEFYLFEYVFRLILTIPDDFEGVDDH